MIHDTFDDEGGVEITQDDYLQSVVNNDNELSSSYQVKRNRARNAFIPIVTLGLLTLLGLYTWIYGPWDKSAVLSLTESNYRFMQCPPGELIDELTGNPTCCNGLKSNCDHRVNEVMFATVHNAMSSKTDSFFAANNILPIEDALLAGYRGLFVDSCACRNSGVQLCHTVCEGGTRDPKKVFTNIIYFLLKNPSEVIIIEIEVNDNTLNELYDIMSSIDDFVDLMYVHPSVRVDWPLMGTLVKNNKRLILFQHNGPNCWEGFCPYGIHDTFENMYDTPYEITGKQVLDYDSISCTIKRGQWGFKSFFIVNHYATNTIGLSDNSDARFLNQLKYVQEHTLECEEIQNQHVSLFVVNFWEFGDVIEFTQSHNMKMNEILFNNNKGEFIPIAEGDTSSGGGGAVPTFNYTAQNNVIIPGILGYNYNHTTPASEFKTVHQIEEETFFIKILGDNDNLSTNFSSRLPQNSSSLTTHQLTTSSPTTIMDTHNNATATQSSSMKPTPSIQNVGTLITTNNNANDTELAPN